MEKVLFINAATRRGDPLTVGAFASCREYGIPTGKQSNL